jgi:hypothetical protein
VAGHWGSTLTGTLIPPTGPVPFANVARVTLGADGNVSGILTSSRGGAVNDETLTGTFTVNPDCTGTLTVRIFDQAGQNQRTAVWATLFDDNQTELRAIIKSLALENGTSVPAVVTSEGRKLFSNRGNER